MDTIILYYKNTVIATLTCPHIHITSTYCVCVERKVHFPAQKSSVITYDKGGLENKEVLKRLNAGKRRNLYRSRLYLYQYISL